MKCMSLRPKVIVGGLLMPPLTLAPLSGPRIRHGLSGSVPHVAAAHHGRGHPGQPGLPGGHQAGTRGDGIDPSLIINLWGLR